MARLHRLWPRRRRRASTPSRPTPIEKRLLSRCDGSLCRSGRFPSVRSVPRHRVPRPEGRCVRAETRHQPRRWSVVPVAPCVDGLQNRLHDTPIGHVALDVISVDDVDLARRRQPRLRQIQQSLTDRAGSTASRPTVPWGAHDGGSRAFGVVRRDRAGRCRLSGSWPPSDLPPTTDGCAAFNSRKAHPS